MTHVQDHHYIENGEQRTIRRVTLRDAIGREYEYDFLVTEVGHEFIGEGKPTDAALQALAEWVDQGDEQ